jgi:hypothetical protein
VILQMTISAVLALSPMAVVERAAELPPQQEPFRECVVERESKGDPQARNSRSSASGKYQFLDSKWRRGLAHMVAKRLDAHGHPDWRSVRARLRATPIHRWDPMLQDVGFVAVLNADGKWSGWRHWYYAGHHCNRLAR